MLLVLTTWMQKKFLHALMKPLRLKKVKRCDLDELTAAKGSTPEFVSKEEYFIEEHETPTPTMDTEIGTYNYKFRFGTSKKTKW